MVGTRKLPTGDVPTNVRLTRETRAMLRQIAEEQRRTLSELLRLIIERGAPYARDFPPKDTSGALYPRRRRTPAAAEQVA